MGLGESNPFSRQRSIASLDDNLYTATQIVALLWTVDIVPIKF